MAKIQPLFAFTEGYTVWALARYFGGGANMLFPNVHFCGGEMDLAIVTRAGYLWEVEIKRTLADWRADERKNKWTAPGRRYVTRFFYAVPPQLADEQPVFVPDGTGLLTVSGRDVRLIRDARRKSGPKLEVPQIQQLLMSTYHRFWNERTYRHYEQLGRAARKQIQQERKTDREAGPQRPVLEGGNSIK